MRQWLFTIIILFTSIYPVYAFQTEVEPQVLKQGDAFALIIYSESSIEPEAYFGKRKLYFNKIGNGIFKAVSAINLNTKPGPYFIEIRQGEQKKRLRIKVNKARFPIQRLTLPEDMVFLSPEDECRANREAERVSLIWSVESEKIWEGSFVVPLQSEILTAFGAKRIINSKKKSVHTGVDFRGQEGEEVKVMNNGIVVFAENLFFGGNTIILNHGQGIYSIYMHLSKFRVKTGQKVSKGDVIGWVGSSGRATGSHLHLGMKIQGVSVNPLSVIKLKL